MVFRYSDPTMDAEAYFESESAASRLWEQEHYRGKCILCGKDIFEGSSDFEERGVESEEYSNEQGWVHEFCLELKLEEDEADEAYELDQIKTNLEERLSEIA